MSEKNTIEPNEEIIKLIGEIYQSIYTPERFLEVLELWDQSITANDSISDQMLEILEKQLGNAIPLLENSFKDIVNKDGLLEKLNQESRPSLMISTKGVVIGLNSHARGHFNLAEGDLIETHLMEKAYREKFLVLLQSELVTENDDEFDILNLTTKSETGQLETFLVSCRIVHAPYANIRYMILSEMGLHLDKDVLSNLKATFHFTDNELGLVDLLLKGFGPKSIASKKNYREDTIKKQIKAIREKAQCPTTTSLICLLASFTHIKAKPQSVKESDRIQISNNSSQVYSLPENNVLIELNSGNLECSFPGKQGLRPLILMHSTMFGFVIPPEFVGRLNKRGYSLIIPFRPGYGLSKSKKKVPESETSNFVVEFVDKMGFEKVSFLGGTIGFYHALYSANKVQNKTVGVVGCACYFPIANEKIKTAMPKLQLAIVEQVKKNRKIAKFLILGGYRLYLQFGTHALLSRLLKNSKEDVAAVEDSATLMLLSLGLKASSAQGVDAVLDDASLILSNWQNTVDEIDYPVKIFHGLDDANLPQKPVIEYCTDNNLELELVDKVGQLMLYSRPIATAEKMADFLDSQAGW